MSARASLLLIAAAGAAFLLSLALPWSSIAGLMRQDPALASAVFTELRLPRALLALIYGATLGASGAAIQALFANPLASPDLTGTTSGAALGAVVTAYLLEFSAPLGRTLPIGVVTAMLGAPFFLVLVLRMRRSVAS
jgi:iron complex transport system permease protein